MQGWKLVSTPLASHFKLSSTSSSQLEEEGEHMLHIAYASAIGSIMYVMVCTKPDISNGVSVSRSIRKSWIALFLSLGLLASMKIYSRLSKSIIQWKPNNYNTK